MEDRDEQLVTMGLALVAGATVGMFLFGGEGSEVGWGELIASLVGSYLPIVAIALGVGTLAYLAYYVQRDQEKILPTLEDLPPDPWQEGLQALAQQVHPQGVFLDPRHTVRVVQEDRDRLRSEVREWADRGKTWGADLLSAKKALLLALKRQDRWRRIAHDQRARRLDAAEQAAKLPIEDVLKIIVESGTQTEALAQLRERYVVSGEAQRHLVPLIRKGLAALPSPDQKDTPAGDSTEREGVIFEE